MNCRTPPIGELLAAVLADAGEDVGVAIVFKPLENVRSNAPSDTQPWAQVQRLKV